MRGPCDSLHTLGSQAQGTKGMCLDLNKKLKTIESKHDTSCFQESETISL